MLGKLLKYEFKYMSKICLPTLLIMLGLCIAGRGITLLVSLFAADVVTAALETLMFSGAYIAIIASSVVITIVTVVRFYRNMTRDEGYLMFTLPASVSAHIGSKTLSALILELLSFLVAVVSGMLLLAISAPGELANGWQTLREGLAQVALPASLPWLIVECVVLSLIAVVAETLKIYAAIALGHLAKKHRVLWAIVSYIGINIVLNFLLGLSVERAVAWDLFSGLVNPNFGVEFANGQWVFEGVGLAAGVTGGAIVAEMLLCGVLFFLTRYILKRHLNLE